MDFWKMMLARKQGGGGGSGGKSSLITFESTPDEIVKKYPIVLMEDTIFVRISSATPTRDELIGGFVGSPLDGTDGQMRCFSILGQFEPEKSNQLFAVEVDETLKNATAVVTYDGEIVLGCFDKEAAAIMSVILGYDAPPGIWVSIAWLGSNAEKWEFALAYNAKEPEEEWINDGDTHIWIELPEDRKSPMLGLAVNGSVTVDWGDGTTPDTLTGTSSTYSDVLWTPRHEYAKGGEHVITVTVVEGQATFGGSGGAAGGTYLLRNSTSDDGRNHAYRYAIKRVELGSGVLTVATTGLGYCHNLREVKLPDSMVIFGGNSLSFCRNLERFIMHSNGSTLGSSMFSNCENLKEVVLAETLASIPSSTFSNCSTLTYIKIPAKVSNVASGAFQNCYSMKVYDFTDHSAVPTLGATSAFNNIPADCEIRVPASLADEWKAANNWSNYADHIVGV